MAEKLYVVKSLTKSVQEILRNLVNKRKKKKKTGTDDFTMYLAIVITSFTRA